MDGGHTGNLTAVDVGTVKLICKTLENVVKKSYGPRGLQTLLSSDTGQLVVTNDGLTVIEALHLSHPVAKLVVNSLSSAVRLSGDGSKTFILWLAECVSQLDQELLLNRGYSIPGRLKCGSSQSLENQLRIHMSLSCQKLLPELSDSLISYVRSYSGTCKCAGNLDSFTKRIMYTVFLPHFPKSISSVFTDLACKMVEPRKNMNMKSHLQSVLENLETLSIKVSSQPYTFSTMMESFIIRRNFSVYCPETCAGDVKFVITRCLFGQLNTDKKNNEKISLASSQMIGAYLDHQHRSVDKFISMCKDHGVTLVLSTEKVSECVQAAFQEHGISVIHFVPEEDATFLETNLRIHAITNVFDLVQTGNIGIAVCCKPVVIADRRYVHLNLPELPPTLLVCGMSDGLCNQVIIATKKALTALSHCYETEDLNSGYMEREITHQFVDMSMQTDSSSDTCVRTYNLGKTAQNRERNDSHTEHSRNANMLCACCNTVPGHGVFEFMAAKFCRDRANEATDSCVAVLLRILSKALLTVPQTLHQNAGGSMTERGRFIAKQQIVNEILDAIERGDSKDQNITYLHEDVAEQSLEPLSMKICLLSNVVQVLQQTLRIDSIVGVKYVNI